MKKDYLGDSVYCEFDGYALVLTTNNGEEDSNRIELEPEVIAALERYLTELKKEIAA